MTQPPSGASWTRLQRTLLLTGIMAAISLATVGYIVVAKPKTALQKKAANLSAHEVFAHAPDDVVGGRLKTPELELAFRLTPTGAVLESPIRGPADPEAIGALIQQTLGVVMLDELEANARPESLANYGLTPPRLRCQLDLRSGVVLDVRVGGKNELTRGLYVATQDGTGPLRLGQSSGGFEWAMDRDLAAFRAKQLLPVPPTAVRRVTVLRDGELRFRVTRTSTPTASTRPTDSTWVVEADGQRGPGDAAILARFALLLGRDLRADAWVTDRLAPGDARTLAALGLEPPAFTVREEGDDGVVHVLRVGVAPRAIGAELAARSSTRARAVTPSEAEDKLAVYAHLEGTTSVARVYEDLPHDLDKGFDVLRDRDLTHFAPGQVAAVELSGPMTGTRAYESSGDTVTRRDRPEQKLRGDRVRDWFLKLATLRLERTWRAAPTAAEVAEAAVDTPAARITLRAKDGALLATLEVGAEVEPGLQAVRVREGASAPRLELVKASALAPLLSKLDELEARP